jgi:hypothetical protein
MIMLTNMATLGIEDVDGEDDRARLQIDPVRVAQRLELEARLIGVVGEVNIVAASAVPCGDATIDGRRRGVAVAEARQRVLARARIDAKGIQANGRVERVERRSIGRGAGRVVGEERVATSVAIEGLYFGGDETLVVTNAKLSDARRANETVEALDEALLGGRLLRDTAEKGTERPLPKLLYLADGLKVLEHKGVLVEELLVDERVAQCRLGMMRRVDVAL